MCLWEWLLFYQMSVTCQIERGYGHQCQKNGLREFWQHDCGRSGWQLRSRQIGYCALESKKGLRDTGENVCAYICAWQYVRSPLLISSCTWDPALANPPSIDGQLRHCVQSCLFVHSFVDVCCKKICASQYEALSRRSNSIPNAQSDKQYLNLSHDLISRHAHQTEKFGRYKGKWIK